MVVKRRLALSVRFGDIIPPVTAREQKKQNTRRALADAAVRMFTERGYDSVTMAEVATEAGVSRRTAFRYFPSKDDLVMEYPAEWFLAFNNSIAEHPGLTPGERIREASYAVASHIESDPDGVRQLFGLAFAHPSIAGRYAASSAQWIERIHTELGPDARDDLEAKDDTDTKADTEARMLAAATMGVINSACEIWAITNQPLKKLLDEGLDLLAGPLKLTNN